MNQKKVLALLLSLCLIVSMTVPVFAAGSRGFSWPWTSSSATVEEEPATTSGGSLVLVEDETTVTEGTELRASTYVLTNDGSASSVSGDVYTEVDGSTTAAQLASSGETYYYLSNGVYYEVTITKRTTGFFFMKITTYTLTANNVTIATLNSSAKLSSAKITLYTKEAGVSAVNDAYAVSAMALMDDATTYAGKNSNNTKSTIKYFPVTMYNYDQTTINNATHQVELDSGKTLTQWNGIYFSWGNPYAEAYPQDEAVSIENGTYILQNARAAANNVGSWLVGKTSGITGTTKQRDATQWTIKKNNDGTYTLKSKKGYMTISGPKTTGVKTASTASNIEIVEYSGINSAYMYDNCIQLNNGSYYLNQEGTAGTQYCGYNVKNDGGNAFYLYKVTDSGTEQVTFASTASLPYAPWNFWTGNIVDTNGNKLYNGNYLYSGLVESTLDANKNIVFTKPEGGIFNSDATVKTIYTNVELPFLYENGTYTFDASQNAVYFHEDSTQGSTTAQSNGRLYLNQGVKQTITDLDAEDGSNTVFMPFNDTTAISSTSDADYWFGMAATVPFTMTTNGRLNQGDDTSAPITFSFSGDDDVWVFIDGHLVIDLGGIHNRLDATIDFAANTVTYAENNTATGAMGDAAGVLNVTATQTLFGGLISQDRTTFAATDSHELTIYYLERGAGSSNCKIQFNLPMKDTLTVQKIVDKTSLTEQEKAQVGNLNFNFTLYKKDAETGEFSPVVNTTYSLLNANGQVVSTPSTSATGRFILQDGQTAKFVGALNIDAGDTYYVVEDTVDGFDAPTYTYTTQVAGSTTVTPSTVDWTSMTINAIGSDEAEDHISIVCTNTLTADRPNPSATPGEDWIVVDYGLSVVIDPLHNDLWRGDSIALTEIGGAPKYEDSTDTTKITGYETTPKFGTATQNADGTITYQLTKQLSQVEVLTYKVTVSGNDTTADAYGLIYIIPATSMYYEENFSHMVTFNTGKSVSGWINEGEAETAPQETGYVRLTDTSPYGSDPAYLNDSGDSNGSSMYVNTTNGSASFTYQFTGTGTTIFARTSNNSGYIRVEISGGTSGSSASIIPYYRDTSYKNSDGSVFDPSTDDSSTKNNPTFYNIPVFTVDGLNYGTYTIKVTIAGGSSIIGSYGTEFWLDGIRVINPLFDPADETNVLTDLEQIAQTAYAADGEANMTVATLRQKLLTEAAIEEKVTDEEGNTTTQLKWDGENFVIFTDTNGEIESAEEYNSNGPKEEVYLNDGQSVTFSLYDWDPNTNKIYLGIKAPTGSGTVSINGNTLTINNAADCYYDISSYATITTDADGINTATFKVEATSNLISVTNIKVTGNAIFTIVNEENIDVE